VHPRGLLSALGPSAPPASSVPSVGGLNGFVLATDFPIMISVLSLNTKKEYRCNEVTTKSFIVQEMSICA